MITDVEPSKQDWRGLHGAPGQMMPRERSAWRDSYGDLPAVVASARQELAAGRLENAWTGYQIALEQWLRRAWSDKSGKVKSPISDPDVLLQKLEGGRVLDRWAVAAIKVVRSRPLPVERWHVEVAAAVVTAMTLEQGDQS